MKVLLLDLSSGSGTTRLRSALAAERYAVHVVTEPAAASWLATDDAVAAAVVCAGRGDGRVSTWCRRLRDGGTWLPVVVILDEAAPADVVGTLDSGADDCVARPVRFSEIAARLRALTRRAAVTRPVVLEVGDLRLEPGTHRVWRGDDEIDLTPREFAILHALMRHPGRALTRETLLESAWDPEVDPASNVVDQHIGRLRRRIDAPYRRRDLETVRGVGYRLRPPRPAAE